MWSKPTATTMTTGEAAQQTGSSTNHNKNNNNKNDSTTTITTDDDGSRQRYAGRRFAQVVRLRPECVAEYKAVHAAVWPEVLQQIKLCNIRDYSIYHDAPTGLLFASFKYVGYDFAGDMERMRDNPRVREWWAMTDGFQESLVPGATSSESGEPPWWRQVEEVFYTP